MKQVIRLKSRYKDCRTLFRNFLGVKPAGIGHVVNEFCSLSNARCKDPAQRCAGLLSLLWRFLTKGSQLDDGEIWRIARTNAFPVLEATATPQVEPQLRSLDSGGWYIPDKTTLKSAFTGKVDLLNLSVKSVQSFVGVFEQLGYEKMTLSSVVEEIVKPRGEKIRDKAKEKDLKTRLKHISR